MSNTAIAPADVIRRYFELDAGRDIDAIVALFSDDATVVDEGEDASRDRRDPRLADRPGVEVHVHHRGPRHRSLLNADRHVVTGRLTGNFPGGTAELKWDFTVAGGRITRLVIAP